MQLLKSGRYLIDHNNQKAWSDYLDQLAKDICHKRMLVKALNITQEKTCLRVN